MNTEILNQPIAQPKLLTGNTARPGRICFVCTGNTCRSPMAEAVFRRLSAGNPTAIKISDVHPGGNIPISGVEVCSAGLFPIEGQKISYNAILALEKRGIISVNDRDIYERRAKKLTIKMLSDADKIICMTSSHAFSAMKSFPAYTSKICSFSQDVPDPNGSEPEVFLACLDQIIVLEKEIFGL